MTTKHHAWRLPLVAALALLGSVPMAAAADAFPREAYSHAVPTLDAGSTDAFYRGRIEMMQSWAVPPEGGNVVGLGPLFNRLACASCHQKNGRGRSPDGPDERMLSMLVRLSVPGQDTHGGPRPHPAYGGQLNEEGTPGVPGEGRAAVHWVASERTLGDGTKVGLRSPQLTFVDLAYGPLTGALVSPRVGQPVYGLGLLEAVPEAELDRLIQAETAQGLHPQRNLVWDVRRQAVSTGRFGWKANSPNLVQQMAEAFLGDMGVTTSLFPQSQCAEQQTACKAVANDPSHPEMPDARLDDLYVFMAHLAPPARRQADAPAVRQGERLFGELGCAGCHAPLLHTVAHPRFTQTLPAQAIAPYSDLMLHDMGEGLADQRPDFAASGRQWRTPPLWGIGLVPQVNGHSQYLHDGRARNLEEAVLWHDGEAAAARDGYARLPRSARQALLAFLGSL